MALLGNRKISLVVGIFTTTAAWVGGTFIIGTAETVYVTVTITYTVLGGLYSVAYTDIIQLSLIFITSCLCVPFLLMSPTSVDITNTSFSHTFQPPYATLTTDQPLKWIDIFLLLSIGDLGFQDFHQSHRQVAMFRCSISHPYVWNSSCAHWSSGSINNPYYVVTYTVVCIGLPLTLVAIYALYSLVQKDHVTPIYVINLLISDLIQLCYMITQVARPRDRILYEVFDFLYFCGLTSSVGFMVCVAMERYLVVAWPLWYHFRRTIKSSVVVCVVVWGLSLLLFFVNFLVIATTFFGVLLLLPLPLFIFFLGGTLRALSASQSVSL
ncbi:hypothetical protein L3Q82_012106 [Scortum barcoo]|uniref:Uncharacterized protein n=1 Tax=Scortum barcoo TaxID=214431 RepID=A0ACB8W6J2_9TELE|nr:hypothetical protein L3Q82_012106 [Scortum barcoo]